MKTKIFGFINDENAFGFQAIAIGEDGKVVASHICSSESWAVHDLGMDGQSNWKHDLYNAAYPGGWETEFVFSKNISIITGSKFSSINHPGLLAAFELSKKCTSSQSAP